MAPNGPGGFFPTNPDLADILGRTDLDFENFHFFDFLVIFILHAVGDASCWNLRDPLDVRKSV